MHFFAIGRQDLTLFKDSRSNLSGPTLSPIHGRSPRNLRNFHFRSDVLQLLVGGLYDGHACDARGRPRPDGIAEVVVSALGFAIYLWSSLPLITMGSGQSGLADGGLPIFGSCAPVADLGEAGTTLALFRHWSSPRHRLPCEVTGLPSGPGLVCDSMGTGRHLASRVAQGPYGGARLCSYRWPTRTRDIKNQGQIHLR